jgi:3-dehydroquinate synthase
VSAPRAIPVTTPGGSYEVLVGPGLIHTVGGTLARLASRRNVFVLTDANVHPLYAAAVETSIREADMLPCVKVLPAGEASKSWGVAGSVLEWMSASGLGRDTVVVGLGGGVVGDLAGFVASTFMRGVPLLHVPTTLLGQIDSSIGGKNGVDLPQGKNLAGTFWQPVAVLADTECLATLPEPEWRSGLAELAKAALLGDEEDLVAIEALAARVLDRETDAVQEAVARAVAFKARVVSDDERESGVRECLNYGHTYGHALERELGYGAVSHGEAVAEGIRFAIFLAGRLGASSEGWLRRQERLLHAFGLHATTHRRSAPGEMLAAMHADKKARGNVVRYVISSQSLQCTVLTVGDDVLLDALQAWSERQEEAR